MPQGFPKRGGFERVRGSRDDGGLFWYIATRQSGEQAAFLRRWEALAFASGWTPTGSTTMRQMAAPGEPT